MLFKLVILFYNLALPILFVIALPAWVIKMWRRGGYGSGLLERLAIFKKSGKPVRQGDIYIHAVSVGEVLIAMRFISGIHAAHPNTGITLAATTSTGHALAREKAGDLINVIYAPVDFPWVVAKTLRKFSPSKLVLIESEAWPNLLRCAKKMAIPIAMVNARLSPRSGARFLKFKSVVKPLFGMIDHLCAQDQPDADRFENIGVAKENIHVTGSMKFDPSGGTAPQQREEFQNVLNDFGSNRPVILLASTHAGEEKLLATEIHACAPDALLLVVPRHAERRSEVSSDLTEVGYEPVLRTQYKSPNNSSKSCLIADTTGELRDWTAHADVCIIGKCWLGIGGQNPTEAIAAGVPVICGSHMENFQALVDQLVQEGGICALNSAAELATRLPALISDESQRQSQTSAAKNTLRKHTGAIIRTVQVLDL